MKKRAVALIDGEHYPPVVVDALRLAADQFDFRAALFLGGKEKIKVEGSQNGAEDVYGLPVVFDDDCYKGLSLAIDLFEPEVVVDLSDEPVLGYESRFRLISHCLARNVGYVGSDFHFSPTTSDRLCAVPSLSIIGTAKRVGKTAVSGYVSRVLQAVVMGQKVKPGVVVVAMGRGGPEEPEVIDGVDFRLSAGDLLNWSRRGRHAASDHFEDAVLSRVVTVGCRRCGGGMAGEPFVSNVAAGARLANSLNPSFVIFEGSGTAIPPVGTDARLLVAGAGQPIEYITGYLGAYRLLTSDALVLTMCEEPLASGEKVRAVIEAVREVRPGMATIPVVFRPRPARDVAHRRAALFLTAPPAMGPRLKRHLEEQWGCKVELLSCNLADRAALALDFARPEMARVDVILTEIKAAAIDVVAEEAARRGLEVVFVDNEPIDVDPGCPGRLAAVAENLAQLARHRFENWE